MKDAVATDPAYQYQSTKEIHLAKEGGARGAYFNEAPEDSFKLAEAALEKHNIVRDEQQRIKPSNAPLEFFSDLYHPMDLPACYRDGEHVGNEDCKHTESSIHGQILQILLALQDIGREAEPELNMLEQNLKKGLIKDYEMHELQLARGIYRDLIAHDLGHKLVSKDILALARDPPSALVNVVERMQALDLTPVGDGNEVTDLQEQVTELIEGSGKDPIDKATMKQIAIHLAVRRGDAEMEDRVKTNRALESELISYIGGTTAGELTHFPTRLKDAHQNDKLRRLEYYESEEEEVDDGEKKWHFQDGMTSAIHSSASKEIGPDELETAPKKLSLIDIVENIDDVSERAQKMQVTRNEYLDTLREVTVAKIAGIKEAKQMFDKRIKKMIKA